MRNDDTLSTEVDDDDNEDDNNNSDLLNAATKGRELYNMLRGLFIIQLNYAVHNTTERKHISFLYK
jgi:hypothetical protein